MKTAVLIASGVFLVSFAVTALPAQALTSKECSAKYQAAKAAGTLAGMKWNDFRKAQCGADATAAPPPAAPPPPPPTKAAAPPPPEKTAAPSPPPAAAPAGKTGSPGKQAYLGAPACLLRRLEDPEGERQASGRNEVAAVLARVRPAQESRRNVDC